jgi:hypothetical protein
MYVQKHIRSLSLSLSLSHTHTHTHTHTHAHRGCVRLWKPQDICYIHVCVCGIDHSKDEEQINL